jgi:CRISPR-associated protein Csm1
MSNSTYQDCALQVAQQGVSLLLKWIDNTLPQSFPLDTTSELAAVTKAKQLLHWDASQKIQPLRLLFDQICLSQRPANAELHYHPLIAIANADPRIPYPLKREPNDAEQKKFKQEVKGEILKTLQDQKSWQNLSLLMLILEKYGSCLSFGEADVALIDQVRITAAIAAALAHNSEAEHLNLIAGDLSGIQNFIYTISSNGALKSLRARSFYLELLTEEIVQQLLERLELPRTNVIYAGGGNLYLLAPASDTTQEIVRSLQQQFNQWLLQEFQGKVFLALDQLALPTQNVATAKFSEHWEAAIKQLVIQKNQKFRDQIKEALKERISYSAYCQVCHRDDVRRLVPLSRDSIINACLTCGRLFRLGGQLLRTQVIVRSHRVNQSDIRIRFKFPSKTVYYRLFDTIDAAFQVADSNEDTIFLINNWTLKHYQANRTVPLLLGNHGQVSEEEFEDDQQGQKKPRIMRAEEFARKSLGIKRVGYLRMDVDRLGQIFAKGLGKHHSLPRLAGLSRQMSHFFKVYLNSLAKNRADNLPNTSEQKDQPNLLFIYAGGDDLFICGSWNQVVDFGCDVYHSFRLYTGEHPDITLSGGISLTGAKFPLYQAAEESGKAEHAAKGNGRDSLGLFGTALKWIEWLGSDNCVESREKILSIIHQGDEDYWKKAKPEVEELKLLGVLPFVTHIHKQQLQPNYSHNFVRNLLVAAQLQEQRINEIEQKRKLPAYENQLQDIRYYLHLPQVAYTLARLPKDAFKDDDFRKSIKHPYNAPYFRAIATWIELLTRNET